MITPEKPDTNDMIFTGLLMIAAAGMILWAVFEMIHFFISNFI